MTGPSAIAAVRHVLYLHGFRSSPQSSKARRMAAWVAEHHPEVEWWCPQLPASPHDAMAMIAERIAAWPGARTGAIGSSLGGFYATAVAERTGCRAVLLNPAIDPARDLQDHVGATHAWHSDEPFVFLPSYVDELRELTPAELTRRERYFAVIAKGDEVLSWHEMTARYAGSRIKLLEGSDHALSDFDDHLAEVVGFLGLDSHPCS